MSKHGKNYKQVFEKIVPNARHGLEDAVTFLKGNIFVKFDETAEIAFRLGVDPSKSDQMVRGTVTLPHGTGKEVRIAVFASGPAADAAREAGATDVGYEDLIEKVKGGYTDFDVAIATPEAMSEVRKLGRVLGPRGLMPNPRTGTVTDDTASAVTQFQAGRVEFKMDRNGNLSVPFGKLSFEVPQLVENARAVIDVVAHARPIAAKGTFIKKCSVSSTMGPGLALESRETNVVAS